MKGKGRGSIMRSVGVSANRSVSYKLVVLWGCIHFASRSSSSGRGSGATISSESIREFEKV